jgi:hypothetical protein
MSKQFVFSLIRHGLTAGAGVLVAKGAVDAGSADVIVGGLMAAVAVGWSYAEKRFVKA